MTSATLAALIETRAASFTAAPIRDPNEATVPAAEPFVELEFPGGGQTRAGIGDAGHPLWAEDGAFLCHVLIPPGTAQAEALLLGEQLAETFLSWQPPAGLTLIGRVPVDGGGKREIGGQNWWCLTFSIAYAYQAIG